MQEIEFETLYRSGQTVKEACLELGIPVWRGYELKKKLALHLERWERLGLPRTFSTRTEEIILGTLLGDGCLNKEGHCKYAKLRVFHSPKQEIYIHWLRNQLQELQPSDVHPNGDEWGTLRFYTPPHPRLTEMFELCYPGGIKTITVDWLRKLSPLSLAVWYMDDGGTQKGAYGCKIATCAFSEDELQLVCEYLAKQWDIRPTVRKLESDNNYPRLIFNSKAAKSLRELIVEHVIPEMMYKFDWKALPRGGAAKKDVWEDLQPVISALQPRTPSV